MRDIDTLSSTLVVPATQRGRRRGTIPITPRPRLTDIARRKLRMLDNAASLEDLRVPPANRLEALKGNRKGQHSIRINDQWRVCFHWKDGDALEVEIVDYHS